MSAIIPTRAWSSMRREDACSSADAKHGLNANAPATRSRRAAGRLRIRRAVSAHRARRTLRGRGARPGAARLSAARGNEVDAVRQRAGEEARFLPRDERDYRLGPPLP